MELRVLGLALNDRKTLRFSRSRYIERIDARAEAWERLVAHTGDLGDWATEGSPYNEDYEEDLEPDADDDAVAESQRVLEYFDQVLDRTSDEPASVSEEHFVGLMARALERMESVEASFAINLDDWLRAVPSITPAICRGVAGCSADVRAPMIERLANSLEQGEIHLDAWQDVWLAWLHQADLATYPTLTPYLRSVATNSPSALARAQALRALLIADGGSAASSDAVAREFDRSTPAGREVLASAVSGLRGEDVDRLRGAIAAEGSLYRLLTPRRVAKRPALKRER
jgi:hypothetical protein